MSVKDPGTRGRKRRAAGWTLLTFGLLVAGVWLASRWWTVQGRVASVRIAAHRGLLIVEPVPAPPGQMPDPPSATVSPEEMTRAVLERRAYDIKVSRFDMSVRVWNSLTTDEHLIIFRPVGGFGDMVRTRGQVTFVVVWPVPAGLLLVGAVLLAWGIAVRPRRGDCVACGYSLAGLGADSPCPECGKQKTSHG